MIQSRFRAVLEQFLRFGFGSVLVWFFGIDVGFISDAFIDSVIGLEQFQSSF